MKRYVWILIGIIVLVGVVVKIMMPSHRSGPAGSPATLEVQAMKSPKGQHAWILEHHHSKVISLALVFRNAGQKSDPAGKVGRAQLAEALFKEGAGEYDAQQLKRKLLEHKIQLNTTCDGDSFSLTLRFPSENLKPVVKLLGLLLSLPSYKDDSLNQERDKLLTTLKQVLHDEKAAAEMAMSELVYEKHPYGRTIKDVITDLPGMTLDDIKEYRKKCWGRDVIEITAVGDLTPKKFLAELDEALKDIPAKADSCSVETAKLVNLGQLKAVPLDIPQTFILFLQESVPASDRHFLHASIVNRILGGGAFKSRLWNDVRENRGLAYHVTTFLTHQDHAQLLMGIAGTKNEAAEQVVDLVRSNWKKLHEEGVTQEELDFAKEYVKGSLFVKLDSTATLCAFLSTFQHLNLGPNFINERNALIDKITLEEVNTFIAETFIKPADLTFIIVGPTAKKQDAS